MSIEISKDQLLESIKGTKDPRLMLDCLETISAMLPEDLYKLYLTEQFFEKAYHGVYYKLTRVTLSETLYYIRKEDAYNFVRKNNLDEDFILTPSIFDTRVAEHKPISGYYIERIKKD